MSATSIILGSICVAFLAGYLGHKWLPQPKPRAVGIDLGTTFSSIGYYQSINDRTEIAKDAAGTQSIPSVVALLPDGRVLVGKAAVAYRSTYPRHVIYDAKRFVGRKFALDDPEFIATRERYPFQMDLYDDGRVYYTLELDKGKMRFTPEKISAIILDYLKASAEKYFELKFPNCVVSVPAEFNTAQRNATQQAAEGVGLKVWRIISEPTAAALAYGLHNKANISFVIVIDLGGGTMDVSILQLQGGMFITQSLAGNNRLGGQDFNELVQRHFVAHIEKQTAKTLDDPGDLQRLLRQIEEAKLRLSTLPETWIKLKLGSRLFEYLLTRAEFERINAPLFDAVIDPINAALEDAALSPADIDEIVLVGGSTRMPRIRQIVGQMFGKAPNFGIDPELAVVTGVAVQADVLAGGWPLRIAAVELKSSLRKRHIYTRTSNDEHKTRTEKLQ